MTASQVNVIDAQQPGPTLDAIFHAHYSTVARRIAAIVRDRGRAEELAVEVFLRWPGTTEADAPAWLHRAAVRSALDEIRRQHRRSRFEQLLHLFQPPPTPEQLHLARDQQARVSTVLSCMKRRDAELLLLRSDGLSYQELAAALHLNAASVGTLLARAQQTFRKEFTKRYGNTESR